MTDNSDISLWLVTEWRYNMFKTSFLCLFMYNTSCYSSQTHILTILINRNQDRKHQNKYERNVSVSQWECYYKDTLQQLQLFLYVVIFIKMIWNILVQQSHIFWQFMASPFHFKHWTIHWQCLQFCIIFPQSVLDHCKTGNTSISWFWILFSRCRPTVGSLVTLQFSFIRLHSFLWHANNVKLHFTGLWLSF